MARWLTRILLVYTIGGGFVGVVAAVRGLQLNSGPLVCLVLMCVSVFGIAAGVMLAESAPRAVRAAVIFLTFQVPVLSLPGLVWQMTSAAGVAVYGSAREWGWKMTYGTEMLFQVGGDRAVTIGVNLVALILLGLTVWTLRQATRAVTVGE